MGIVALATLLVSATPVHAEWQKILNYCDTNFYVDLESIIYNKGRNVCSYGLKKLSCFKQLSETDHIFSAEHVKA